MSTSKPKFQIGDKVKVIDDKGGGKVGQIKTIIDIIAPSGIDTKWFYRFASGAGLYEHRLELVEEPVFKPGVKVRRLPEYCEKTPTHMNPFIKDKVYTISYVEDNIICIEGDKATWDAYKFELVQEEPKFKEGRLYASSWDNNKQKYTCTYVSPLSGVAMMERENPVGSLAVYKDQQHYWTEVPEKAKGTVYIHWAWAARLPNKIVCDMSLSPEPRKDNLARHIRTDKIECEADIKS